MKQTTLLQWLIATLALLSIAPVYAQEEQNSMTYLSCDFSDEIPADFALYDLDGQTHHYSMVQSGIKQGCAWSRIKEIGKSNYFAASACRYKAEDGQELKPADDWLITSRVWVRGNNAKLTWDGISLTNMKSESCAYEVLISTSGNKPEDFTAPALFTTDAESMDVWSSHEIDLSDFQGRHIYIAFHNNSAKGEILGIDNILVKGDKGSCELLVTTGTHIYGTQTLNIEGTLTSYSDNTITQATLYCEHNGTTYTYPISSLQLHKNETYNYRFPQAIDIQYGDTAQYKVWGVVENIEQDTIYGSTTAFMFKPNKGIVVEEGTGMWCNFCPGGILALEILAENYPDNFIGVAIHQGDDLEHINYFNKVGFDGLPAAWVNRRIYSSPPMVMVTNNGVKEYVTTHGGIETHFIEELAITPAIEVNITHTTIENNTITIDANVRSAIDLNNLAYHIEYALVENNVWKEGYYQMNGYAGQNVKIGGYENLPAQITTDIMFQHVARQLYRGNNIPATLQAGEAYTMNNTFELPSTILNNDNLTIVAMIIDTTSGNIVNARESSLKAGIHPMTTTNGIKCRADKGYIDITLPQAAETHIQLFNTTGTLVGTYLTTNPATQIASDRGLYIVRITHNGNTSAHKVIVK